MSKGSFKIDYTPRVWQQYIHDDKHRFRVVLAHRGCGKSFLAISELIKASLLNKGVYAYAAPEKAQGKRNVWSKIKDMIRKLPGVNFNETEARIDFPNGSQMYLLGTDNPDNIRGMHLSGVVVDEVADMDFDAWGLVLRPALQANSGWALFIGTRKKGENLFNHVLKLGLDSDMASWNTWNLTIKDTGVFTEAQDLELRGELLPSQYAQEYMNEETSSEGEIYATLLDDLLKRGQIGMYPYDPKLPVFTGWDIGYNDYTCIWFAQMDRSTNRIYIIDFYKNRREYMAHYVNYMLTKPYRYGTVFLPHDIDQTRMDKEYTEIAKFKQAGLKYRVLPRTKNVMSSVQAVQSKMNRCFFNENSCKSGLEDLKMYDTVKDRKTGRYTDKLTHNDSADAFRYLMEGLSTARSTEEIYQDLKKQQIQTETKKSPMQVARRSLRKPRN